MFKFIHCSDFHIWDKHKYSIDNSRLDKIEENIKYIIDYAIDNKIYFIVVTGDIMNVYNPDEKCLKVLAMLLRYGIDNGIQFRLLMGDHDTNGIHYSLESMNLILQHRNVKDMIKIYPDDCNKNYTVYQELINCNEMKRKMAINFIYVPFQRNLLIALRSANELKVGGNITNILVSHFGLNNAVASSGKKIKNIVREKHIQGWDCICLGDYHKPQKYYSGSVIRINWGERKDKKSFRVITVSDEGKCSIKRVPLNDIDMIEFECSYDELNELVFDHRSYKVKDSYIKLFVSGDIGTGKKIVEMKKLFFDSGASDVMVRIVGDGGIKIKTDEDGDREVLSIDGGDYCKEYIKQAGIKNKKYLQYGLDKLR